MTGDLSMRSNIKALISATEDEPLECFMHIYSKLKKLSPCKFLYKSGGYNNKLC